MIRFVYPNVDSDNRFIGCGRYTAAKPDDPNITNVQEADDPHMGSLSKVLTVASMLGPKSFETGFRIYEHKDQDFPYLGDSKGLAYLLALMQRESTTRWNKVSGDVWCTGAVHIVSDRPFLKEVFANLFDAKIQAFVSQTQDRLFIVPLANLKNRHMQMAESANVRVMSLSEFRRLSGKKVFEQKTILKIHGNELESLVRHIFGKSAFPFSEFMRPEIRKYGGIGLLLIALLFALFRTDTIAVQSGVLFWKIKLLFSSGSAINDPVSGLTFIWIPGGCFEMGCDRGKECFENETPVHTVCLNPFYMSRNEVTQEQWKKIMQENPSVFPDCGQDCPVESVSWKNVQEFIRVLHQHPEIVGKYRLPTEAQWEYVCKTGSEEEFRTAGNETHPAGKFCSESLGLCDIKGNVLEWCEDSFQDRAYDRHSLFDPLVSGGSEYKVVRGRSWSSPSEYEVCTRRFRYRQDEKFSDAGFRLVWEIK